MPEHLAWSTAGHQPHADPTVWQARHRPHQTAAAPGEPGTSSSPPRYASLAASRGLVPVSVAPCKVSATGPGVRSHTCSPHACTGACMQRARTARMRRTAAGTPASHARKIPSRGTRRRPVPATACVRTARPPCVARMRPRMRRSLLTRASSLRPAARMRYVARWQHATSARPADSAPTSNATVSTGHAYRQGAHAVLIPARADVGHRSVAPLTLLACPISTYKSSPSPTAGVPCTPCGPGKYTTSTGSQSAAMCLRTPWAC